MRHRLWRVNDYRLDYLWLNDLFRGSLWLLDLLSRSFNLLGHFLNLDGGLCRTYSTLVVHLELLSYEGVHRGINLLVDSLEGLHHHWDDFLLASIAREHLLFGRFFLGSRWTSSVLLNEVHRCGLSSLLDPLVLDVLVQDSLTISSFNYESFLSFGARLTKDSWLEVDTHNLTVS